MQSVPVERVASIAFYVLLVLIFFLSLSLDRNLTDSPNRADARQNLASAFNLAYRGVISTEPDLNDPAKPSNYREPLPIILLAAHIALHPALSSGLTAQTINEGEAVVQVKRHNLMWAFLCLLGVALTLMAVVRPPLLGTIAAAIAVILVYSRFLSSDSVVDRMMTELQAATLLVWCSFALTRALQTKKPVWFVVTGLLLGGLALTKGHFLYVGAGLVVVLLLVYLWRPPVEGRVVTASLIALLAASMAATVTPWLARNWILLDTLEITERGGAVLLIRAYKNQMNDTEYVGGFYHYAPSSIKSWMGTQLGFSRADLEAGGRLQRLNRGRSSFAESDLAAERAGRPQDAVTFYRSARAERIRLRNYYSDQGVENPRLHADRALRDQAINIILSDPVQHLKTTILFLWRGTYLYAIPILFLAAVGLFRRSALLIGLTAVPAGALFFLALTSHFLPRYAYPMYPSMFVVYVSLGAWVVADAIKKYMSAKAVAESLQDGAGRASGVQGNAFLRKIASWFAPNKNLR